MGYVAANLGGVENQIPIVEQVARANVEMAPHQHQHLVVEILATSLLVLNLRKCLNTEMIQLVLDMDSTPMMLSLLLLALSMALAQPVI